MKRFFVVLFLLVCIVTRYTLHVTPISAQSTACDLCGFCEGGTKPSDYDSCVACLYTNAGPPPSGVQNKVAWTVLGCFPTTLDTAPQKLLQIITTLIGGVMFIVFLYGGFKILTSAGEPDQLATGKRLVTSSVVALLIIIFAVFILRFVGVEILKIPGLG